MNVCAQECLLLKNFVVVCMWKRRLLYYLGMAERQSYVKHCILAFSFVCTLSAHSFHFFFLSKKNLKIHSQAYVRTHLRARHPYTYAHKQQIKQIHLRADMKYKIYSQNEIEFKKRSELKPYGVLSRQAFRLSDFDTELLLIEYFWFCRLLCALRYIQQYFILILTLAGSFARLFLASRRIFQLLPSIIPFRLFLCVCVCVH